MPRKFSNFNIMQALMRPYLNDGLPLAPKSVFELISLYMLILEFGPINSNNNNMNRFMIRVVMLDSTYLLEKILHLCDHTDVFDTALWSRKNNIFMYMLESKYINWGHTSITYLLQLDFISDEYIINKNIVKDMLEKISYKEWIITLTYHERYNLLKYIIITYPSYILYNGKKSLIKILKRISRFYSHNNPHIYEFLKFYLNYDLIVNMDFSKNDVLLLKIKDSNPWFDECKKIKTISIWPLRKLKLISMRSRDDPELNTPTLITPNDDLKKLFIAYQDLIDISDKKLNKILFTSKFYLRFCIFFDYR